MKIFLFYLIKILFQKVPLVVFSFLNPVWFFSFQKSRNKNSLLSLHFDLVPNADWALLSSFPLALIQHNRQKSAHIAEFPISSTYSKLFDEK